MTRQTRWLKYPDLNWLSQNEVQGDALRDLQTEDNKLSVFRLESDEDAERVVVALAANRENLANLDYAVFEGERLTSIDINVAHRVGETPDEEVNKLHYHLINLTVERLAQLAAVVSTGQHVRVPRKELGIRLQQAVRSGTLDRGKLKPQLLERIG